MAVLELPTMSFLLTVMMILASIEASDSNRVYSPCSDTTVEKSDGFTFGIAFASNDSFFFNRTLQLSPCDRRLSLNSNSQIAVFRPKVDQISLLTINTTTGSFSPVNYGYMVAFAGRKYAARSSLAFVADSTHTVTSFTLVLEFKKGRLQNLYWKSSGCAKCSGNNGLVCIKGRDCAFRTTSCKGGGGGNVDCSLAIQLAFSGTDKHLSVFNSWYEVENLRQYSLYDVYSNLKDSLTSQYSKIF